MGIEAYRTFADQAVARGEGSLAIVDRPHQEGLGIQHAINPPGRMVCWLANHPRLPMSDRAYARVNGFLDQSRQILAGFAAELRTTYGKTIAGVCIREAGGIPLTARKIKEVIDNAERMLKQNGISHRTLNGYLGVFDPDEHIGEARRAPAAGHSPMDQLFAEHFHSSSTHHLGALSWEAFAQPKATAALYAHIEARCAALPSYAAGHLREAEVDAVARQAVQIYFENLSDARGDIGTLTRRLAAAPAPNPAGASIQSWTRPYPPPSGKDLRDLPSSPCRKDLLAFAEKGQISAEGTAFLGPLPPREAARLVSNLAFLEGVARFRQSPTWKALDELFHQFIDADSDQQIYLGGDHLKDTMARVLALRVPTQASEAGVDPTVFDAAFDEIATRMEQTILPAFLKSATE